MANYKDIVGTAVRNNAGNLPSPETGQVWFDSTNLDFKYLFPAKVASWRSEGNLNTARYSAADNIGTETAAIAASGQSPGYTANVENWDGSSWTEIADVNTARSNAAGAGITTSALIAGGYAPGTAEEDATEIWNGSAWTEVADQNTARYGAAWEQQIALQLYMLEVMEFQGDLVL